MFNSLKSKIFGFLAGLSLVAGMAVAANTFYAGFLPQTNQTGINGLETYGGPTPIVSGTCGTIGAVTGGTSAGTIATAAVTSCTLTLTLPVSTLVVSSGLNNGLNQVNSSAAPNGLICTLQDITHPAVYALYSSAPTTTSCSFAAQTITAGDVFQYTITGY